MTEIKPIPTNKKLLVQFRLEPGCLGPQGDQHIDQFCQFAQNQFEGFYSHFVDWEITPRLDKSLPEIQYGINQKQLNSKQVSKYLQIFKHELSSFEESLDDKLAEMIDHYLSQ